MLRKDFRKFLLEELLLRLLCLLSLNCILGLRGLLLNQELLVSSALSFNCNLGGGSIFLAEIMRIGLATFKVLLVGLYNWRHAF